MLPMRTSAVAAGVALALSAGVANAQSQGGQPSLPPLDTRHIFSLTSENDAFSSYTDRWYTAGNRGIYQSPEGSLPGPVAALDRSLASIFGQANTRWGVALGQLIYTPEDKRRRIPDPTDHPYAGYSFLEFSLDRRTENTLDRFFGQIGVVGPSSLAKQTQDAVHVLINDARARGWHSQIKDEPALNLGYQRIWRVGLVDLPYGFGVDALPALAAEAGTVNVYGQGTFRIRFGQELKGDFGPGRIRQGGSDSPAWHTSNFGWYVFGGAGARVVGRDITLDGSTWRDHSPSVERRNAVGDFEVGAAMFWRGIRVSFLHDWRTREFVNQKQNHHYGSITLSMAF